jgi:hypothetical protein
MKLVTITGCAVLAVAMLFVLLPPKDSPFFSPRGQPLSALLDRVNPPGWTSEDQPLGDSEYLSRQVEKTLRFDDAFYRAYRRGGTEVGVYVAYWKPGKLDPWLIALHTPDSCWVLAGAEMTERDDHKVLGGGAAALEAKFRRFRWPSSPTTLEVVFWHLYGGKLSGFPVTGQEGRLRARWAELLTTLRNTQWGRVRQEQVFVRISTNRTMDELVASDLWPALMEALAPTGIVQRESGLTAK